MKEVLLLRWYGRDVFFREGTAWWDSAVGATINLTGIDKEGAAVSEYQFVVAEGCSVVKVESGVYKYTVSPEMVAAKSSGWIEIRSSSIRGVSVLIGSGGAGGAN